MIRKIVTVCALSAWLPLAVFAEEASSTTSNATTPEPVSEQQSTDGKPFLGLVVNEIDDAGFDGVQGLKVEKVITSQTAEVLGLQVGDILQSFNGTDVRTRADLSKLLAAAEVGSEVTASWMRGDDSHAGSATMGGRPSRSDIRQQMNDAKETHAALQAALVNQNKDKQALAAEQAALGLGMAQLATVLEALPEQLQMAADEFKAVYPEGEFEVSINISIKSNANSDDETTLDLSPKTNQSAGSEQPVVPASPSADPQAAAAPVVDAQIEQPDQSSSEAPQESAGPLPPPAE